MDKNKKRGTKRGTRSKKSQGSAKRRKQQRIRSESRRKDQNKWDYVQENARIKKRELIAKLARERNDKRKYAQASKCLPIRFEGRKNLGWDRQASNCYFKNDAPVLPPQTQTKSEPSPTTPVYHEEATPFGGYD